MQRDDSASWQAGAVGQALPHDSAALHVTGGARYVDDLPEPPGTLHGAIGMSPVAHGRLRALGLGAVRRAPGVAAVLVAADIPGENNYGSVVHDDPVLAAVEL